MQHMLGALSASALLLHYDVGVKRITWPLQNCVAWPLLVLANGIEESVCVQQQEVGRCMYEFTGVWACPDVVGACAQPRGLCPPFAVAGTSAHSTCVRQRYWSAGCLELSLRACTT